jgi:hypothetical protein
VRFGGVGLTDAALTCPHCNAPLDEHSSDRARGVATCTGCGNLVNLKQLRLGDSMPPRARGTEAARHSGKGGALLVVLLIAGSLALFLLMTNTSIKGSAKGGGALAGWELTPDSCLSGQREGFGGVLLGSDARPGRALRIVNDPVKGTLLVVVEPGRDNRVFERSSCSRFDVRTVRSNTNVNDIWAIDGHADFECPELRGQLKFEGCH